MPIRPQVKSYLSFAKTRAKIYKFCVKLNCYDHNEGGNSSGIISSVLYHHVSSSTFSNQVHLRTRNQEIFGQKLADYAVDC